MADKTASQLNEQHDAIEQMAQGLNLALMAHVFELLQKRQHYARDYIEKCKRFGRPETATAYAELLDSINEKINEALLTTKL